MVKSSKNSISLLDMDNLNNICRKGEDSTSYCCLKVTSSASSDIGMTIYKSQITSRSYDTSASNEFEGAVIGVSIHFSQTLL